MTTPAERLGRIGVWAGELRRAPEGEAATHELEHLGWSAAWIPGGFDDRVLADVDRLLAATHDLAIGTGILNIWKYEPADVAAWWKGKTAREKARVMIGVGVSHGPAIGAAYAKPLEKTRAFLQGALDAGMARENLCVAALGPKMLELSAELTAGAHPYLVTPEHTAIARKTLGAGLLLAPEQGVVLETDPQKARAMAREALGIYLGLPNYTNNWKRLGFTDEDISSVSDRLVDALFAWGDAAAIRNRVQAHLDAGADHVCIQVVKGSPMTAQLEATQEVWRKLAPALVQPV
jgi:probable F420-dependent oxidoreductase